MPHGERWETAEQIGEALRGFERQVPGWVRPAAHGTVLVTEGQGSAAVRFPVVNVGAHNLPAVVMGLIVGRVDETATYEVPPDQLDRAVELLAPAEAAAMFRHPNLAAWREMQQALRDGVPGRVFAVFVADLADPSSGPLDDALRAQIAAGERADLHAAH